MVYAESFDSPPATGPFSYYLGNVIMYMKVCTYCGKRYAMAYLTSDAYLLYNYLCLNTKELPFI